MAGNATDGQIPSMKLRVLEDDKKYFPPYEAAVVVRRAVLESYPGVRDALGSLAGTISVPTMAGLNYEVDGRHRAPADVVRELRG